MSTSTGALENAFREHASEGGAVLGVDVEPMQLDLLRNPETGRLPSDVFRRARQGEVTRRGRPAGARNKRNAKLAQLIVQQHGDPVMFMASVYAMPLDQLVELLQVADGSADREDRLLALCGQVSALIVAMTPMIQLGVIEAKKLKALSDIVERIVDAAAVLRSKPGELAVKALASQIVAAREVGPYVHGKQPLSVEIKGKADMVLLIPGLNAPLGVDPAQLQAAVETHGLDAIDFDNMQLVDHAPLPDDEGDGDDD